MKAFEKTLNKIEKSGSMLCIGLDTDLNNIPNHLGKDIKSILDFNYSIIDSTKDFASAYKINFAFYEQYGNAGFDILKKTADYIPSDILKIADAKRADIGNSSKAYAIAVFDELHFDSVTVSPYMGMDSILPFFEYDDKLVFILALTSNPGSMDFQKLLSEGEPIYQYVIRKSIKEFPVNKTGFVVGATHPDELAAIRNIAPYNILLIPGVGTQGGDIEGILKANSNKPALINVSRDIIYQSNGLDYAVKAGERAEYYKNLLKVDFK
jgi:orotidine-5'-phosphate decarboxylase